MRRMLLLALSLAVSVSWQVESASAASKKKQQSSGSRDQVSAAEREKIHLWALDACRKKYGTRLSRVHVDYRRKKFICYIYY